MHDHDAKGAGQAPGGSCAALAGFAVCSLAGLIAAGCSVQDERHDEWSGAVTSGADAAPIGPDAEPEPSYENTSYGCVKRFEGPSCQGDPDYILNYCGWVHDAAQATVTRSTVFKHEASDCDESLCCATLAVEAVDCDRIQYCRTFRNPFPEDPCNNELRGGCDFEKYGGSRQFGDEPLQETEDSEPGEYPFTAGYVVAYDFEGCSDGGTYVEEHGPYAAQYDACVDDNRIREVWLPESEDPDPQGLGCRKEPIGVALKDCRTVCGRADATCHPVVLVIPEAGTTVTAGECRC